MFGSKVRIDRHLLEKAKKYAAAAGYTSVEEFVGHLVERELAKIGDAASEEEIRSKLRGLGYIS